MFRVSFALLIGKEGAGEMIILGVCGLVVGIYRLVIGLYDGVLRFMMYRGGQCSQMFRLSMLGLL